MALIYAKTFSADITAGLKLSYDHPHFIPLSLFPITPHNAKQLPLHFAAGAVQLVKKVL